DKTRNEVPAEEPQLSGESSNKPKLFNYTKARYEVMRFALSGFEKEKQIKSKVAMAIRLGAKPPKKEYTNYKVLMQEKLEEKERKKNEAKHHLQTTKPRKKRNLKKYKKQLLQASKQGKKDKKQPNNLIK
ncbi:uncharacterized protein C1orf131-like, partial [Stegodyphus dumicola]|uniref:uncharacterized protein C1orf131-like n=1 Tax=Stegodyphus dumicola TaxID=202533 RepID=UPI0015B22F0A